MDEKKSEIDLRSIRMPVSAVIIKKSPNGSWVISQVIPSKDVHTFCSRSNTVDSLWSTKNFIPVYKGGTLNG
jgi:hypothetical protein